MRKTCKFVYAGFDKANLMFCNNTNFVARMFLVVLPCLISCGKNNPILPVDDSSFAIYFLRDTTLTIKDITNTNLEALELADKPWLSQDDIEFYDWSSHCLYLKKDKSYFFPGELQLNYRFPKLWTDRPWIVVSNGKPRYAGYFGTEYSIDIFPFPEIDALIVGYCPTDILASNWNFWFVGPDIRFNELVKKSLIQCGLYHGGIEVSIDTNSTPIRVFNDDTTTVEYTLKLQNNDQDNIYIFDPSKVDSEIFHFYSNGPNFWDLNSGKSYSPQYMKTRMPDGWPDEWNSNWYTLLKSGESVKRTIRLKGYPYIPSGTYLVQTGYGTPRHALEKNIRETPQGRYYVRGGEVHTDTVRVTITN